MNNFEVGDLVRINSRAPEWYRNHVGIITTREFVGTYRVQLGSSTPWFYAMELDREEIKDFSLEFSI